MSEENIVTEVETVTPAPESIDDLKPKMKLKGTVERLELYGAFIDLGIGVNALIHISQLSKEHVNRVSDVLSEGDEVTVWVEKVDPKRQQVMVTMIEPLEVEWRELKAGQVYTGKISRLEDYGAFVDIGAEREGLVHISELSHDFVKHPREVVSVGSEVDVQVLGFSRRKRRIDLSMKALTDQPEIAEPEPKRNGRKRQQSQRRREERQGSDHIDLPDMEDEQMPTAMEIAMRKAMGDQLPSRSRSSKGKGRRRGKKRSEQEEILDRTLKFEQDE